MSMDCSYSGSLELAQKKAQDWENNFGRCQSVEIVPVEIVPPKPRGRPRRNQPAGDVGRLGTGGGPEFSETPRGQSARDDWAEGYDDLNGAPEGPGDC